MGLLGNTRNEASFSFLSPRRFRRVNDNKAAHFTSTITWISEDQSKMSLDDNTDPNQPERIKYIPQGLFDNICNEIASGPETAFDMELKKVIFSHVKLPDRLGMKSLDELIKFKTDETYDSIAILKEQLSQLNGQIITLEEKIAPDYREQLESARRAVENELETLKKSRPSEEPEPAVQLKGEMQAVAKSMKVASTKRKSLETEVADAQRQEQRTAYLISITEKVLEQIGNFEEQFVVFANECADLLKQLDIELDTIITLDVNAKPITDRREMLKKQRADVQILLDPVSADSLIAQREGVDEELRKLLAKLDEPNRLYQAYLEDLRKWELQKNQLVGDPDTPNTTKYYDALFAELESVPQKLTDRNRERTVVVKAIYAKIKKLASEYMKLYSPVQKFINDYPLAKKDLQLRFDVSIIDVDFHDRFFDWIGRNVVGSFYGSEPGEQTLKHILNSYDFNVESGVIDFLQDVMDHLTYDKRSANADEVSIPSQLRHGRTIDTLYDYIFSLDYLRPRYVLKLGDKELSQLSPGERGVLLLVFYLLIDLDDIPLIIDQPEENLDNQTVFEILVGSIKEAKQRRQIVMVTHNPNLAVVCDAEQVIVCYRDMLSGNQISYLSGSIENPIIKRCIVDIGRTTLELGQRK